MISKIQASISLEFKIGGKLGGKNIVYVIGNTVAELFVLVIVAPTSLKGTRCSPRTQIVWPKTSPFSTHIK